MSCNSSFQVVGLDNNSDQLMESMFASYVNSSSYLFAPCYNPSTATNCYISFPTGALPSTDAQVDEILLESFLSDTLSGAYTDSSSSNSPLSSDEELFYARTNSSSRKRPPHVQYPLGSPKRLKENDDFLAVIEALVPPSPESGISLSSPKAVPCTQSNCNVWLKVLEEPEEVSYDDNVCSTSMSCCVML